MIQVLKIASILALLIVAKPTLAQACDSNCQLAQITAYFSALDKVARKGSTLADIDTLLALTHENVKYVHVEYQANFSKDTWRQAFISNLEKGSYQKTDKNQIRILEFIEGKDHIAVKYSHGVIQQDGKWQPTAPYLALFGFTDGKLSLIKELW